MQKIIFLDIDGVLATPECLGEDRTWGIVQSKQDLLSDLLIMTGAKIVLSSSWRKNELEATKQFMTDNNFRFSRDIIGITIRAYQWLEKGTGIHLSIPRGVEIKQWIDANIHSNNGKDWNRKKLGIDFNYVILDDESDMLLEQSKNFVQCQSEIGLTSEIIMKAKEILNTQSVSPSNS